MNFFSICTETTHVLLQLKIITHLNAILSILQLIVNELRASHIIQVFHHFLRSLIRRQLWHFIKKSQFSSFRKFHSCNMLSHNAIQRIWRITLEKSLTFDLNHYCSRKNNLQHKKHEKISFNFFVITLFIKKKLSVLWFNLVIANYSCKHSW